MNLFTATYKIKETTRKRNENKGFQRKNNGNTQKKGLK